MSGGRQELCPACGRGNQCGIARTGSRAAQCWCMDMEPAGPTDTALADMRPGTAAPGTACFCRNCLTNEKAPALARASASINR